MREVRYWEVAHFIFLDPFSQPLKNDKRKWGMVKKLCIERSS